MDSKQQRILARQLRDQKSMQPVDCACVIHGDAYGMEYVEKLYHMLDTYIRRPVRLHVFTEAHRSVPEPFIKHDLIPWPGVHGPRKSWWYKMQMFDSRHLGSVPVLYLDLDVIIVGELDWIWQLDHRNFYAIRDFKCLWRQDWQGMNSSVMFWTPTEWHKVWEDFQSQNIEITVKQFHGDQDFLNQAIQGPRRQYFDQTCMKSWRWQLKDGGLDTKSKQYHRPDAGTVLDPQTRIMIFHGRPKPHEVQDPIIQKFWHDLPLISG